MTYVIHDSLLPIFIYRFRPMVTLSGRASQSGEETVLARKSDARYPCGSCSFPRIIRIRFPPREEPQTINQAQNRKIHSSTPPPRGRLPKDRREKEPRIM